MIWGTCVPRKYAEEINEFLAKYGFTKVQLIEAGFKALIEEAAETDTFSCQGYGWLRRFLCIGEKVTSSLWMRSEEK